MINPLLTKLVRQDGWILALFFFCIFMDLDFISVHKNVKKRISSHPDLTEPHAWSITHTYLLKKTIIIPASKGK